MTSYVPAFIERVWARQKVIHVTCPHRPTGHNRLLMTLQRLAHAEPNHSVLTRFVKLVYRFDGMP